MAFKEQQLTGSDLDRWNTRNRNKIITEIFLKMRNSKIWSSPRVNFRAFAFHYIYDLPPIINTLSEPILFTDDTIVIISSKSFDDFSAISNTILSHMSKWFTSNKLVLNIDKTRET
jgi:hypothetical protein